MSKQPKNLNAVFDRLRRRMLVAQLEPARRTMPATPPEPPPRLPGRALGEYVPVGRVDPPSHTSCSAPASNSASSSASSSVLFDEGAPGHSTVA